MNKNTGVATQERPEHGKLIKILPPNREVVVNGIDPTLITKDFGHPEVSAETVVTPGRTHPRAKAG